MKTLQRAILIPYDFVVFYLGMCVFGMLCLGWTAISVMLHPLLPRTAGARIGRAAIMLVFRVFLGFLRLSGRFHFELHALDALKHDKSLIIAPNHPSLWDAVLIVSRLPETACVMKSAMINNVFVGAGARLARYIRNESTRQMILLAVAELRQGGRILLFPEGTRTVSAPVNPFKGSIGVIACRAGASVQTVFIETDSAFLTKGWPVYKKPRLPIRYRIRLGRRFAAGGNSTALVAELDQYFRDEMTAGAAAQRDASSTAAIAARQTNETISAS